MAGCLSTSTSKKGIESGVVSINDNETEVEAAEIKDDENNLRPDAWQ